MTAKSALEETLLLLIKLVWFAIGLFLGSLFGTLITALCVASSDAEKRGGYE